MKPIAYCSKNTKKQLLLSAVVSPKLMRESETAEVWVKNLQDNLFRALGKKKSSKSLVNCILLVKLGKCKGKSAPGRKRPTSKYIQLILRPHKHFLSL